MHFDPRTGLAFREVALSTPEIETVAKLVSRVIREGAMFFETSFEWMKTALPDMSPAHSDGNYPEDAPEYVDLSPDVADFRGHVRLDGWGAPVEDGRVLKDGTLVELSPGPTVDDRIRFAHGRSAL